MREKTLIRTLLLLALLSLTALAAGAQETATCPDGAPWSQELPLDYPPSIVPSGGVLDTPFVVRTRDLCVPVWTQNLCKGTYTVCNADADCGQNAPAGACANAQTCANDQSTPCSKKEDCNPDKSVACTGTWGWEQQTLRTYGFPKDADKPIDPSNPDDPNIQWGFPGPTLRARTQILQDPTQPPNPKTNPQVEAGTRIKLQLYNYLEPQHYHDAMQCNSTKVCQGTTTFCSTDANCASGVQCVELEQMPPECFHGDNVTNLHYHGTHVSPQPPQDFVLLSLFPFGSQGVPKGNPNYAVGQYDTDINPLPWNQAPGTHWYHPHKHGSTSIQVLNGMSGSLIITGPFDDWLNHEMYRGKELVDRVLVVQQVTEELKFFNKDVPNYPPKALINGYATPKIRMRPGEIQRFRFIGATMQASAALEIGFDQRIQEVYQIAQDGVQFASANYKLQPLRDKEGTYNNFKLSPGNRADFLIKAPHLPGTYAVGSRVVTQNLAAKIHAAFGTGIGVKERVPRVESLSAEKPPINPASGNPLLFTIEVSGETQFMDFPLPNDDAACQTTPKPARCWPATPSYLRELDKPSKPPRKIEFSMVGQTGAPPSFYINKTQYDASCAGATMTRGSTEDWLVSNVKPNADSGILPHPFHIHTNPFQVVRNADRTFDPPIWQDTIALPTPTPTDRPAGPIWNNDDAPAKCQRACAADNATWNGQWTTTIPGLMSVCGCLSNSASVLLRHKFEDYTGGYVIHCHFLGHEDRGMMWNVQTVCEPPDNLLYGETQTTGGPDNCATTSAAFPKCDLKPRY